MQCPHCGFAQPDGGGECLACGVVFAKLRTHEDGPRAAVGTAAGATPPEDDEGGLWPRLLALLTTTEPKVNPAAFGGRVVVWAIFFLWGVSFLRYPVASPELMDSFMHVIDLVFHEAGHVVLMPLGWRFLMFLGGSLGQLAVPLICTTVLLIKTRDPFGASIGLWWTGQSLMDLAPYIGDARALQLPLLGGATGAEVEGHDWEAILGALGWLPYDRALAGLAHVAGALLIVSALGWGAYVLVLQRRRLDV